MPLVAERMDSMRTSIKNSFEKPASMIARVDPARAKWQKLEWEIANEKLKKKIFGENKKKIELTKYHPGPKPRLRRQRKLQRDENDRQVASTRHVKG